MAPTTTSAPAISTLTANGSATITGSQGNCLYYLNHGYAHLPSVSTGIYVGAKAVASDTASGSFVWVVDLGGSISLTEINSGDHVCVSLSGAGAMSAWGGSNSATIVTTAGQSANVVLISGNAVITSYGSDLILTGSGNAMITNSGYGDNVITIAAETSAHSITINNFNAARDSVLLTGFAGSTAITGEHLSSAGLAVSLADGSVINFTGATSLLGYVSTASETTLIGIHPNVM